VTGQIKHSAQHADGGGDVEMHGARFLLVMPYESGPQGNARVCLEATDGPINGTLYADSDKSTGL
jgi:hypothetical protein